MAKRNKKTKRPDGVEWFFETAGWINGYAGADGRVVDVSLREAGLDQIDWLEDSFYLTKAQRAGAEGLRAAWRKKPEAVKAAEKAAA